MAIAERSCHSNVNLDGKSPIAAWAITLCSIHRHRTPIFGIPVAVLYFIAVATCIAASIVAAYIAELRRGEID